MRQTTLAAVSFCIAFAFIFGLRELLFRYEIWTGFRSYAGTSLLALLLSPLIALLLTPLNRRLLEKRKEQGRDIVEEERYESDHGMITLTPKDKDR